MQTDEFNALDIDGAAIVSLAVNPPKKIDLRIFTFPSGKEYFLNFFKIAGFQVNLEALPSEKIISHGVFLESIFLQRVKQQNNINLNDIKHYQFNYEKGFIDIAAEGFICSLIWESDNFIIKD